MKHNYFTYWLWFPTVLLLGLLGCVGTHKADAALGGTKVNGVWLQYQNAATIVQDCDTDSIEILGGTLSLDLHGTPEPGVNLQVSYMEYLPGDATIYLENGKISSGSKSGKPVAINSITGSIPEGLSLAVNNGTGKAKLTALKGNQSVSINIGTGSIDVIDSRFNSLFVKTGTGSVGLKNSSVHEK
jgi:hypothetical protein